MYYLDNARPLAGGEKSLQLHNSRKKRKYYQGYFLKVPICHIISLLTEVLNIDKVLETFGLSMKKKKSDRSCKGEGSPPR